ncbi:hypothetical protein C0995_001814, partial [Termitomyces sp. Mi166
MNDFSITVTVKNNTNQFLTNAWGNPIQGRWHNIAKTINPGKKWSFLIDDTNSYDGSEGRFGYDIYDENRGVIAKFDAYQRDPVWGRNEIRWTSPLPRALFFVSVRTRIRGHLQWKDNTVNPRGHPFEVEYTIGYEFRQHFQWQLIEITTSSDHPVRNSRQELILGQHTLWKHLDPSIYPDETRGSFQPNIFAYDFISQVAVNGILNVTVRALNPELIGAAVILFGIKNGTRAIQSDYFMVRNLDNITVQAHVIDPRTSGKPFSLNADVEWHMELALSNGPIERVGEGVTRLELYWIATTLHLAFRPYVPVTFLRAVLPPTAVVTPHATIAEFYQDMTKRVFNDYHKRYDTILGQSMSNLTASGGSFYESFYLLEDPTGELPVGAFVPFVNCMDQAAMLELSCSLRGGAFSTSWLYQSPFGYINTTHLIGITNYPGGGGLINVNNPFFGNNIRYAELRDINDLSRLPFGVHVYIGHSNPYNPKSDDGIYDGCSGPHLGNETIAQYITNSIDTKTNLYQVRPWQCRAPGTIANVTPGFGVLSINGQWVFPQRYTMPPLTEPISRLIDTAIANMGGPMAHLGWARLRTWLAATLGDPWKILYEQVT